MPGVQERPPTLRVGGRWQRGLDYGEAVDGNVKGLYYSTVTLLAKFLGLSTSQPLAMAA
jgi:hypothetical protein